MVPSAPPMSRSVAVRELQAVKDVAAEARGKSGHGGVLQGHAPELALINRRKVWPKWA